MQGERALTGRCPPRETCSEATPSGLFFVGRELFDHQAELPRLGPIAERGTLHIGLIGLVPADREMPLPHEARVDAPDVLSVVEGSAPFGPTAFDAHVVVTGREEGEGHLRIVDPATGELYDRAPLAVVSIDDVAVVSAIEPSRPYLYASCEERVGVRLLSGADERAERAIDDSMTVVVAGVPVSAEPEFWDSVVVTVPDGVDELAFEIRAGGRDFVRTLPVRSLATDGLTVCPEHAE